MGCLLRLQQVFYEHLMIDLSRLSYNYSKSYYLLYENIFIIQYSQSLAHF